MWRSSACRFSTTDMQCLVPDHRPPKCCPRIGEEQKRLLDRCATFQTTNQSLLLETKNLKQQLRSRLDNASAKLESPRKGERLSGYKWAVQAHPYQRCLPMHNEAVDSEVQRPAGMIAAGSRHLVGILVRAVTEHQHRQQ